MDVRRGDLVFIDLGHKRGSVQCGARPCVIVQNDLGNRNSNTTIIAPITGKKKKSMPTHVEIKLIKDSTILCEQITVVDKRLILKKIGSLTKQETLLLDNALKWSVSVNER